MKITKKILENIIKEEISKIVNEQSSRKEIKETRMINGVKYMLLGQIITMFGTTRIDLRLILNGEVVAAARNEKGEDVNELKARLLKKIKKQPTK